ncbi:hypothetical protein BTJ40_21370 [Microbulbifer sp. A4B17]|nr:hypothetical protein BTJ40_21370 [Microbulbifer sp. A4B17]
MLLGACVIGLLVGCSGGSGGNKGSGTNVLPEPDIISLSVQGRLIDGPTTNAIIQVFAGDSLVLTNSSPDGTYSVQIDLDETQYEDVVKIVATSQDNSKIKFASTLGPFSSLIKYAGDDGVLESSESYSVNISSVSTAVSAILEAENDFIGKSFEEWEKALKLVDAERTFSVATAIKIFIDYSDKGISIPEEVENTYLFASDYDLSSEYVNLFSTTMEDLFNEVQNDMGQIPDLFSISTNGFNETEGTYYLLSEGDRITLYSNGTGEYLTDSGLINLTWSKAPEGISLELEEPIIESYYMEVDGEYYYVDKEKVLNRMLWMLDDKNQGMLVIEFTDTIKYPDYSGLPDTLEIGFFATNSVRPSGLLDPRDVLVIGKSYSMPIPNRDGEVINPIEGTYSNFEISSLKMSFLGEFESGGTVNIKLPAISGNGELIENDLSATWKIDDSHRLVVNLSEDEMLVYSLLKLNNDEVLEVFVEEETSDGLNSSAVSTILLKDATNWYERDIAGVYVYPQEFLTPLYKYFFDFSTDGIVSTIYVDDLDGNGSIERNEYQEREGLWQIKNNGNLSIRFYRSEDGYCMPDSWDPAYDADCALYLERDWDLYQVDQTNKYWFSYHLNLFSDYYFDSDNEDVEINGHILSSGRLYHVGLSKVSERPVNAPEE